MIQTDLIALLQATGNAGKTGVKGLMPGFVAGENGLFANLAHQAEAATDAAKIAALVQPAAPPTKTADTSFVSYEGLSMDAIAVMLAEISPGSAPTETTAQSDLPLNIDILEQIKIALQTLQRQGLPLNAQNLDAITKQLNADLQAQGLDQETIDQHLSYLSSLLIKPESQNPAQQPDDPLAQILIALNQRIENEKQNQAHTKSSSDPQAQDYRALNTPNKETDATVKATARDQAQNAESQTSAQLQPAQNEAEIAQAQAQTQILSQAQQQQTLAQQTTVQASVTAAQTTASREARESRLATTPHQPTSTQGQKTTASAATLLAAQMGAMQNSAADMNMDLASDGQGRQTSLAQDLLAEGSLVFKNEAGLPATFANYMNAARMAPAHSLQMVGVQLARNANARIESMTLRLDPADLGQLDIRLKFGNDGKVKAHLVAEKPETLAMLQRDATHLERTLQQAGVDLDDNAISFDLRQHDDNGSKEFSADMAANKQTNGANNNDTGNAENALLAIADAGYISATGVNILV